MKSILKLVTVAAIFSIFLVGCKSAPVYNIDSAAIAISDKHSSKDIKKAIIRAGATLGWSMKSVGKGHMIGTLYIRKHVAVVDITYNKNNYSIRYKNSTNLNYDGANIHSNYNGWIKNLHKNIQIQIKTL